MKRMLIIAMVVLMALSITACGKGKKIDTFLNAMELSVKADEDLIAAGNSTFKAATEIIDKYSQMISDAEGMLKIPELGTKVQQEKYFDLKKRIEMMASQFDAAQKSEAMPEANAENTAMENGKTAGKDDKNTIDALLDTYETMVQTYEKKGSKLSVSDVFAINKKMIEMNNAKKTSKMTAAQTNRLLGLIERLTILIAKK